RAPECSAGPAPPGHSAVARVGAIRAIENICPTGLALRLDDLIAPVERTGEDHADVRAARKGIHDAGGRLRDDVVRSSEAVLEVAGGIRAVNVPEGTPVIAPVAPRVGRLPPRLERQARAVSSLPMCRRVTRGIRGIRVDVVVVPAATAPLVTLVTRGIGVVLAGVACHRRHERRGVVVAVRPEAVIRLRAACTCEEQAGTKGEEKDLHRGSFRSKRSTNAPAAVEPS